MTWPVPLDTFYHVSKVEQIEAEISALEPTDIWKLDGWLADHAARLWDTEMARDARSAGPLDRLAENAIKDFEMGHTKRLP